jgi:hypothetical protein
MRSNKGEAYRALKNQRTDKRFGHSAYLGVTCRLSLQPMQWLPHFLAFRGTGSVFIHFMGHLKSCIGALKLVQASLRIAMVPSTCSEAVMTMLTDTIVDVQGYDGKVAADIDHKAYMPAAWRVDEYLDGDDDLSLADLSSHRLVFSRAPNPGDDMERDMDRDDLEVWAPR